MSTLKYKVSGVIAAAAIGPYAATETEVGRDAMSSVTTIFVDEQSAQTGIQPIGAPDYAAHSHYEIEALRETGSNKYRYDTNLAMKLGALPSDPKTHPSLAGQNATDLREVLRFDISPDWVINRFSRVSTVLAETRLKGLRVPVVTGIKATDVAGTLTFYFDRNDRLQRLTLHGFTGDPNPFAQLMINYYGLVREPALEAGAFTKRWNGKPVHFMRLTHAPVVYSDAVHQKYTVFLELNQPNLAYGISEEARAIVHSDRSTGRW